MYLLIDVGGTTTRLDFSNDLKNISKHNHFPTPQSPLTFKQKVKEILFLEKIEKIKAIVIGLPGVLNKNKNKLQKAPNLTSHWLNLNFQKLFKDISPKIFCQNDAALAALGEASQGAAKDYNIVAFINIGTGIGGAKILKGKIEENASGFEIGHHIIIPNGRKCSCGQRGCFEAYASGTAFKKIFNQQPKTCLNQNFWDKYAEFLGQGLINVILFWSPEILILGGSMLNKPIYFWKPLMKYLKSNLKIVPLPKIKFSKLKNEAGVVGGLIYLKQILEK